MTLEELNNIPLQQASDELIKCCGSSKWVNKMVSKRPFSSLEELLQTADEIWAGCGPEDGLEAFQHHPKIGDLKSLEKKFASTSQWSQGEQQSVSSASLQTLQKLQEGNKQYEEKFGFIFIVCATGKSADEMLGLLEARIGNERHKEIKIAMEEQRKITAIRLNKLIS